MEALYTPVLRPAGRSPQCADRPHPPPSGVATRVGPSMYVKTDTVMCSCESPTGSHAPFSAQHTAPLSFHDQGSNAHGPTTIGSRFRERWSTPHGAHTCHFSTRWTAAADGAARKRGAKHTLRLHIIQIRQLETRASDRGVGSFSGPSGLIWRSVSGCRLRSKRSDPRGRTRRQGSGAVHVLPTMPVAKVNRTLGTGAVRTFGPL